MNNQPSQAIESNPAFIDQKLKHKKALCAAFAMAACSVGIVGYLANDNVAKQKMVGIAVAFSAALQIPSMRRRRLEKGMVPIRAMSESYGEGHPYQAEADRLTAAMNLKKVTVYKSTHMMLATSPVITDMKDIYISADFDAAVPGEGGMKAIIAHELGHYKEDEKHRCISNFFDNVTAANVMVGGFFALTAPLAPEIVLAVAGCAAMNIKTIQYGLRAARACEHMADLYAYAYVQDKNDVTSALNAMIPTAEKAYNLHVVRQNEVNRQEGKPLLKEVTGSDPNYNSAWRRHPNIAERLHVVNEAIKYTPQ